MVTGVDNRELHDTEQFVSIDNWVFESFFIKVTSKIPLLFDTILQIHVIQMEFMLVVNLVHVERTRMIEAVIYSLSKGNNLGGVM